MAEETRKKGRGCLFYGVIVGALVLVGVAAGIYFGSRKAILMAVEKYTSNAPVPIPKLTIPEAEQERAARELANSARKASEGNGAPELVLGEQELNLLLLQAPDFRAYREQIYLRPEGSTLKAQMSVPLDQFGHWKELGRKLQSDLLTNRYLNGTADLNLSVTNGVLNLSVAGLTANGQALPEKFTERIQAENLAAAANNNPEMQAALQKVDRVEVKDGKVNLHFKR